MKSLVSKLNRQLEEMLPMDENMLPLKFSYSRPYFIDTKYSPIKFNDRTILSNSFVLSNYLKFGYAEIRNNRDSFNEDQACFGEVFSDIDFDKYAIDQNLYFFVLMDGHLGWGPSIFIRENFYSIFKKNLYQSLDIIGCEAIDIILPGILEKTFIDIDNELFKEHYQFNLRGGTTCLVVLIHGKKQSIFVANTGDSRALLVELKCSYMDTNEFRSPLTGLIQDINHNENSETQVSFSNTSLLHSSILDEDADQNENNILRKSDTKPSLNTSFKENLNLLSENTSMTRMVGEFSENFITYCRLTKDCSPINERGRIYSLINKRPSILDKRMTTREYFRPVRQSDIGKPILFRGPTETGWVPKIATTDDLRIPVIANNSKKGRLLGRLGVVKGFGDFRLKSTMNIPLKPFISSQPDITKYNLLTGTGWPESLFGAKKCCHKNYLNTKIRFIVMATDGVWDVCSEKVLSQLVSDVVNDKCSTENKEIEIATRIIQYCIDEQVTSPQLPNSKKLISHDDISIFVINLLN